MAVTFVLLNVETGAEREVIESLRKFTEVKEAHSIDGAYDIIARLEADSMEEIKNAISWGIRRLTRVRSTTTMIQV
ncbi:MAG: Lrp/AsnC ligand binding domain-containing protein [Candidatus Bathyarchaeota archaeon]|nr:Lrp/AsnC ligand binding domain-containing protein [Candidatus Bathyarchaeota archaeon]